ncbi:hypothetical protein C8F04DRAFT_1191662 [Mycena alexandri]|uniref:Uncharacterized protein n=1 Tax=Mycena alexandri TaxID=1745969 RepID=A0AAD6SEE9_9AGAR|nr:hypothetical protein C8F04DRAFT_1191662 [Mycena alexandri]
MCPPDLKRGPRASRTSHPTRLIHPRAPNARLRSHKRGFPSQSNMRRGFAPSRLFGNEWRGVVVVGLLSDMPRGCCRVTTGGAPFAGGGVEAGRGRRERASFRWRVPKGCSDSGFNDVKREAGTVGGKISTSLAAGGDDESVGGIIVSDSVGISANLTTSESDVAWSRPPLHPTFQITSIAKESKPPKAASATSASSRWFGSAFTDLRILLNAFERVRTPNASELFGRQSRDKIRL